MEAVEWVDFRSDYLVDFEESDSDQCGNHPAADRGSSTWGDGSTAVGLVVPKFCCQSIDCTYYIAEISQSENGNKGDGGKARAHLSYETTIPVRWRKHWNVSALCAILAAFSFAPAKVSLDAEPYSSPSTVDLGWAEAVLVQGNTYYSRSRSKSTRPWDRDAMSANSNGWIRRLLEGSY